MAEIIARPIQSDSPMPAGVVAWAEIDLDAIAHNVSQFKRHVGERGGATRLIAVVKANAYGHGAVQVAQTALQAGADMLAVNRLLEGVALRKAGIQSPILIMGYTPADGAEAAVAWNLTPSLTTIDLAQALSQHALAAGVSVPVHVKVDSGMGRYGLLPDETLEFLHALSGLAGIRLEGLFTHFATADWADPAFNHQQLTRFIEIRDAARQAGFNFPIVHAANSAAAMRLPQAHLDAIRLGVGLYGLDPSSEWPPVFEIRPALALKSRVARVRWLEAGASVGYGRSYITPRPTLVALIPVGYGDGYHRVLSNQGAVLIRGRRAPIIGRVSMDQFVVDVTFIPGVQQDDEVVLIGAQGSERIRAEEVAALAGTINYEVTTSLLARVVRVYLRGGEVVGVDAIE